MRQQVLVRFAQGSEFVLPVTDADRMQSGEAQRWLDDQFVAHECEPLRATGKVLTADKVLVLARTVGRERFQSDPAWAADYARAVLAALGRMTVQVEVDSATVAF